MFLKNIFSTYFWKRELHEPGGYVEIWRVAWPLVLLNASNTIMMVTNRIFLAKSSPEEIAAAMPTSQLFFTMMAFFLITTGFTATIVAQFHGNNDRVGCVRAGWNGFYFGVMMAALLMFLLPICGQWIFTHNGHDPRIAVYELEYFVGMAPCAGLACLETALLSFFTGRGKTGFVALIKCCGCLVCVPLNYMLVFGVGNIPPLGILGAGVANSLANLFSFSLTILFFLFADQKRYPTRGYNEFCWSYIKKLFVFGTPAGLQTFIRNMAFSIVVMMIGHVKNEALAATSIALSINMIGSMPMIGLLDATSIVTGQYIGRGRVHVAERVCGRAIRMFFAWLIIPSIFYIFFPELLIRLFGSSANSATTMDFNEIVSGVKVILWLAVFFNAMDGIRFIVMGSLRGAGDTKIPLLLGIATSWSIQIPGTVLLVYCFKADVKLIWLFLTFYVAADAVVITLRRRSGAWKSIKVIDTRPPPASFNAEAIEAASEARTRL